MWDRVMVKDMEAYLSFPYAPADLPTCLNRCCTSSHDFRHTTQWAQLNIFTWQSPINSHRNSTSVDFIADYKTTKQAAELELHKGATQSKHRTLGIVREEERRMNYSKFPAGSGTWGEAPASNGPDALFYPICSCSIFQWGVCLYFPLVASSIIFPHLTLRMLRERERERDFHTTLAFSENL